MRLYEHKGTSYSPLTLRCYVVSWRMSLGNYQLSSKYLVDAKEILKVRDVERVSAVGFSQRVGLCSESI